MRIVANRFAGGGFCRAFDNFDTGVVPEPGTGVPLASGLALLQGIARRRGLQRA